jgi:hypothetical protein
MTNDIFLNISSNSLISFKKKNISEKEIFFENFNISENNIISVKLAQVITLGQVHPKDYHYQKHEQVNAKEP